MLMLLQNIKNIYQIILFLMRRKKYPLILILQCVQFTVDKVMNTVKYPLPSIEDVLWMVGDVKIFSKIDLSNAYLQLPLDDKSKHFTAINTSEGLYYYNYLPL